MKHKLRVEVLEHETRVEAAEDADRPRIRSAGGVEPGVVDHWAGAFDPWR